jgi:hypothetical protein
VKRCVVIALLTALFSSPILAVWAAPFENADIAKALTAPPNVPQESEKQAAPCKNADIAKALIAPPNMPQKSEKRAAPFESADIAKALTAPPNVPQESEKLVRSFLDYTLPHLLADDERLAHQLGLDDSMSNPLLIDRALPIMLIRRDDVMELMGGRANPLDLVNNTNNWRKDKAGRLVPSRIVFSLRSNNSNSEAGPPAWSSVTLEQSREGSWRIIQVGAPKLSRAMRQYENPGGNQFLLWIPDLNRHYLGQIDTNGNSIFLTTLFPDRLTQRNAGECFDATSEEFIEHLIKLYDDLELPRKLRGKSGQSPIPTQKR